MAFARSVPVETSREYKTAKHFLSRERKGEKEMLHEMFVFYKPNTTQNRFVYRKHQELF